MNKHVALVTVVLTLVGCAQPQRVWRHHSHSDAQRFNIESMQCQQYAAQVAPYRAATYQQADFMTSVLFGQRAAQFEAGFMECMQRLGYYLQEQ